MANLRTIEIDFDIHKKIEAERMNFEESPNAVLRRLLKLPVERSAKKTGDGLHWQGSGVSLAHGTIARMEYSGVRYEAKIVDGKWSAEGQSFDTPSGAASAIATTKDGSMTKLNGWHYWKVQRPGTATWVRLMDLRKS